jgi:streptogramin lyase/PKD repeat protein
MQQRNGDIWVKGLNVFAHYLEKEKRFQMVFNGYENEQSIAYNRVNSLFEDKEENIWVATDFNGLYRFNPHDQFFTNVRQVNRTTGKPGNGSTMSFIYTKQATILSGTWEDGPYQFDHNYNMIPLRIRGLEDMTPAMWSMYASKDSNTIWMGAQPGIWRIDQAKQSAVFYNPEIIKNRTVRQIAEDRYGNLWMGTQSLGVFKWTAEKGKVKFDDGMSQYKDILPSMISKITIDKNGYVWIGTTSLGVYAIDPSTDKVVLHLSTKEPEERKLLWDGIASILQYDDTTMIIAANSLSIYNTALKRITKTIPLPEIVAGSVMAIERDHEGYVWMSTTSGLFRVNIRNKIFILFNRTDGITNDRFILAASYVLPDGKMLFGADNQFVIFDPAEVQINDISPDVKITGFKLANESLLVDSLVKRGRVELGSEDNSITIEFSGLSYNAAYIIKYKLEGLDKDWKVSERDYHAVYSYLPPGTYTLKLQSADAEGHLGKNITELIIKVNPPFWKTWWFFCIIALAIAAIFYWLDKQRVNKLVALQTVRTEIASNLHEEVNTTLNNINLLSEMARIKADKDIDRSKEFIEQISTKSHNMILAMDDILWSIDPGNDSMERSLLRMMEFADVMKNLYGANIEIALDKKVRSLQLDMKTRHEMFLLFKEALILIIKYSGGKESLVHIDLFRNKLSIKLQDATANFDKNVAEIENSIREMNTRAALLNADLDVQYDKKGIAIILLVPVK